MPATPVADVRRGAWTSVVVVLVELHRVGVVRVEAEAHAQLAVDLALVDGLESLFWYDAVDEREVNGQLRVRFRFDADDSDPVEFDEDDND